MYIQLLHIDVIISWSFFDCIKFINSIFTLIKVERMKIVLLSKVIVYYNLGVQIMMPHRRILFPIKLRLQNTAEKEKERKEKKEQEKTHLQMVLCTTVPKHERVMFLSGQKCCPLNFMNERLESFEITKSQNSICFVPNRLQALYAH